MKKVFLAIAVAAVFTACNNGGETPVVKPDSTATKMDSTAKKMDSTAKKMDSTSKK